MNLRSLAFCSALACLATVGCARPAPRSTVNADSAVATTLSAADVETDMPKVGKAQHPVEVTDEEAAPKKDAGRRHDDKRSGGGFSGYK